MRPAISPALIVNISVYLFESKNLTRRCGLFADFDTTSTRLGNTVEEKNRRLCAVLHGVESLDFGRFADHKIDLFGDAYEFLISNYAANAGKSGGEFFTPQNVSRLLATTPLVVRARCCCKPSASLIRT